MVNESLLKYFLVDNESLGQYTSGVFVEFNDIKRRLFVKIRDENKYIPDHYYRLAEEKTFQGIDNLCLTFTSGIVNICNKYLELEGNRVYVKVDRQNEWHEMITYIPPLFLQSVFLFNSVPLLLTKNNIRHYYDRYILPNTKYTSLPSPKIPQLDYYINQKKGLHDLHMHLNGSLETDLVWQDYLKDTGIIHTYFTKSYKKGKVKEQLLQEYYLLNPNSYISLLKAARKLRFFFYEYLFLGQDFIEITSKYTLLKKILNPESTYPNSYIHPFAELVPGESDRHLMSIESLMYILIINEISKYKNEAFAGLFHFYLLILGLTNRLLVQQTHQKGFEQFQKLTLNGLREQSESVFLSRYFQMHGNESRNIKYLEGRFSPKNNEKSMIMFIDQIWNGWENMKKEIANIKNQENEPFINPELKLIAHFIKEEDRKPDPHIRHKELRYEIWNKAKVLSNILKRYSKYRERVVAVDAAASEFDTPPEVFAPVFRLMRKSGVKHFTYHAGEDFSHIVSGLRAIYEAIVFCGLQQGNRIGHATATGISVDIWHRELGNHILIRQGEYLDNLVFAYHMIIQYKIEKLEKLIPFIINRVQGLSYDIYNTNYPITILEKAWLMRGCCPVHYFSKDKNAAQSIGIYNEDEWNYTNLYRTNENKFINSDNKALEAFLLYHNNSYSESFNKILSIDIFEILKKNDIEELQLCLLSEMTKREIVIETLPTSNVRIGFHRSFSTYHLWNWIKWQKEDKSVPPIVVGSDDTGIFATNIYNEYANIYCSLLTHGKLSHNQIMDIIKKLDEDSHIYRFAKFPQNK